MTSKLFQMLAVLLFVVLTTGCQTAMSNAHSSDDGAVIRNTFPLKFKEHDFGAFCFNTLTCKIVYAGAVHGEDGPSSAPTPDYLKNLSGGHGGIKNFPSPAVVTWRSLDGVGHEEKVDIREIFKDQRVFHRVPEQDIPTETAAFSGPEIILVVNDRTVSVYMKTMIYLKERRIPTDRFSDMVEETTLAYTRTY